MPNQTQQNNLQDIIKQHERECAHALERSFEPESVQLQLFDAFQEEKSVQKHHPKNEYGYTLAQETYAHLRACGHTRTYSWRMSHPHSQASDATVWSKASQLDKQEKVQARILWWKRKIEEQALMSTTELFSLLTKTARSGGKDAIRAQELIGKIHGVFKCEKDLPGTVDNPLTVRCINFEGTGAK